MRDLPGSLATAVLEELAGNFNQHRRMLRLSISKGKQALLAETLRGEEELGRGFRFELGALSLDSAIPLKSLLGQPVLVELLTDAGAGRFRPFHGHIIAAEITGANGGFARYHLTIGPWTTFMGMGRDSRIFQNKTVFDILDVVFKAYHGKGRLVPAWRFDIADRGVYLERSIATQYQESDLAFVERLLSEEGLFYFFEHNGEPSSPSLGCHTLVIADHNGAFVPNVQADIRYTRPGAVMKEDSIDRWRTEYRMQANAVELGSWDYRSHGMSEVSASTQERDVLCNRDTLGPYAFPTREQAQRRANGQLDALQARREIHVAAGTVRTLAPPTTFTLRGHSKYDGGRHSSFAVVRVCHLAHNTLKADTDRALTQMLGACKLKLASDADLALSLHAGRRNEGDRPVYRNRIDAIPSTITFRPRHTDDHGRLLHPRPVMSGQQTAIVVGAPGAAIHTDRDHRIQVQFHWQRGVASHSRQEHPCPSGHVGAPGNDRTGTWIRVATPLAQLAGANWGGHALPRVGQEVLVDFLEGDIDRPVVIGAIYNGRGRIDAQHNQAAWGAGASTGNAPAWFPGEQDGHAHPAVISGMKSQAMQHSQDGTGAFGQLVFDDSPGQARMALQRHARAHEGTAELNLGHLRHQVDNQLLAPAGFGTELKSEHSVALRAGQGMLLTSDGAASDSEQLLAREAAAQIAQATQLATDLAATARKHHVRFPAEFDSDGLAALGDLRRSAEVVQTSQADGGGRGGATAFGTPHLQLSAPAGVSALTSASAMFSSGASSVICAGQDVNIAAQRSWVNSATRGTSLFTYGKVSNPGKPGKETGIRLHSASGKVSSQSQAGSTHITADKAVTVASVTNAVAIAACKHVLLTAQGACIKLEGGNIEVHAPGKVAFKATRKELAGPASSDLNLPTFPRESHKYGQRFQLNDPSGMPLAKQAYTVFVSDQQEIKGKTDAQGMTALVDTENPERTYILFDRDLQWICDEESDDDTNTPGC